MKVISNYEDATCFPPTTISASIARATSAGSIRIAIRASTACRSRSTIAMGSRGICRSARSALSPHRAWRRFRGRTLWFDRHGRRRSGPLAGGEPSPCPHHPQYERVVGASLPALGGPPRPAPRACVRRQGRSGTGELHFLLIRPGADLNGGISRADRQGLCAVARGVADSPRRPAPAPWCRATIHVATKKKGRSDAPALICVRDKGLRTGPRLPRRRTDGRSRRCRHHRRCRSGRTADDDRRRCRHRRRT